MKTFAAAAFAAATFAALSATPSAAAEVRTQYPGAACLPLGNAAPVVRDLTGRIVNASATAFVTVVCPVVRNVTASVTLEFAALSIQGSISTQCFLAVTNSAGSVTTRSPSAIRPVAGVPNTFRYQFADGDVNINAPADSVVHFRCNLAPSSSLLNTAIVENVNES